MRCPPSTLACQSLLSLTSVGYAETLELSEKKLSLSYQENTLYSGLSRPLAFLIIDLLVD